MSTSKLDASKSLQTSEDHPGSKHLTLPANAVTVRQNGIEFRSVSPITTWAEMSVDLESPWDGTQLSCRGVVVSCNGNRHAGYIVSLMFMNLTPQLQQQLNTIALSHFGF